MKSQDAVRKRIIEISQEKNLSMNKVATNCFINTSTITSLLNGHSKKVKLQLFPKFVMVWEYRLESFLISIIW